MQGERLSPQGNHDRMWSGNESPRASLLRLVIPAKPPSESHRFIKNLSLPLSQAPRSEIKGPSHWKAGPLSTGKYAKKGESCRKMGEQGRGVCLVRIFLFRRLCLFKVRVCGENGRGRGVANPSRSQTSRGKRGAPSTGRGAAWEGKCGRMDEESGREGEGSVVGGRSNGKGGGSDHFAFYSRLQTTFGLTRTKMIVL
jgi:hypothetical protein